MFKLKWKTKKYHTVGTILKSIIKIERDKIDTTNIQIQRRLTFLYDLWSV